MVRETPDVGDSPMTGTYLAVIAVETAIIVALWLFGRAFS